MSKAISMTQAAKHLGLNPKHLKKLTEAGELPYWFKTDSGRFMYAVETLDAHARLAAERHAS